MNDTSLVQDVAKNLGLETDDVSAVIDEFMLLLHKRKFEYVGMNGDYVGEELHFSIGPQGFFHLVGFLSLCSPDPDAIVMAGEMLARLGDKKDWQPFNHQMDGWVSADQRRKEDR